MLAGRRPLSGATDVAVMQAIVGAAPESLGGEIPVAFRMAVEKALEKDPAERYQSMREMVVDLKRLGRQSVQETHLPAAAAGRSGRRTWAWVLAGVVGLAIGGLAGRWLWRAPAPGGAQRPVSANYGFHRSGRSPRNLPGW